MPELTDVLHKVWVEVEASGINADGVEDHEQHLCEPLEGGQEIAELKDAIFLQIWLSELGQHAVDHIKYLRNSGHCPSCGGDDIEGAFIEVEGDNAFQKVSCGSCYAVWSDQYALVGCEILEEADGTD